MDEYNRRTICLFQVSADKAKILDKVIFISSLDFTKCIEQVLWPAHCVQKSFGAALHRDLVLIDNAIHVYKGTNPEIDSYSAFWDNMKLSKTSLDDELKQRSVTDVYVVGLATDVCVGRICELVRFERKIFDFLASTAMHAVESNYRTVLIEDACRGVNEKEIEVKRVELNENGCIFVDSNVVS